ncbi:hypothetical protein BDW72DRAFT_133943 [Aspergillus terricola var. indicus]
MPGLVSWELSRRAIQPGRIILQLPDIHSLLPDMTMPPVRSKPWVNWELAAGSPAGSLRHVRNLCIKYRARGFWSSETYGSSQAVLSWPSPIRLNYNCRVRSSLKTATACPSDLHLPPERFPEKRARHCPTVPVTFTQCSRGLLSIAPVSLFFQGRCRVRDEIMGRH